MALRLDPAVSNVSDEVIASYAVEADRAQRDIDEATGRKRSVLKRAKSDGIKTRVLLAAIKMKKQDPDEVALEMRDSIRYANIIAPGVRLTQAELFSASDAPTALNAKTQGKVQDWDAEQRGYESGLNGGTMDDCVFAPGTEGRVHFQQGFVRGQTVIADRMGENAKKADPSRTKRRGGKPDPAHDDGQTEFEDA